MKPQKQASVQKQVLGDLFIIAMFGLLAFGIYSMGESLSDDIRLLRTEGVAIEVDVLTVSRNSKPQAKIRYVVDGVERIAHEKTADPTPLPGSRVWGFYHPDNIDRVRLRPLDEDTIYSDMEPFRMLPIMLLAPLFILVVARVARVRGKNPYQAVGPAVGLVLLACLVGVNFAPEVQESISHRLGPTLFGLPSHLGFSAMQLLIVGPLLWIWGSATMVLQGVSLASGAGIQRIGLIFWAISSPAARAHPAERKQFLISGALLIVLLIVFGVWLTATDP